MRDPVTARLDELARRIDELKREYDLFLAGRRKGEPEPLRREVERDVLRLTRFPFTSTAARFRAKTLAHRFQALDAQVRQLLERKAARGRGRAAGGRSAEVAVVVDRVALESPAAVEGALMRLHGAVAEAMEAAGRSPPPLDVLRRKVLGEAGKHLGNGSEVAAVRFWVDCSDGGVKLRGTLLPGAGGTRAQPDGARRRA